VIEGRYVTIDISKRHLFAVLGCAATCLSTAWARATSSNPRVAVLMAIERTDPESQGFVAAFEQGMLEAGWINGVNVQLDYRWGSTDPQRAMAAALEVSGRNPSVIVAVGSPVVVPLQRATSTIPIVFAIVSDPVSQGLVLSLGHPGRNITGFSHFDPEMGGKWLELLKEIAPHTRLIAVMFNPATSPYNELFQHSIENAASSFKVEIMPAPVNADGEIEAVFERLAGVPNGAVLVPSDAYTYYRSPKIVLLAARSGLPAIYAFRRFVDDGGLVFYGPDPYEEVRSTAFYVDRILKGAEPSELPVQQPSKFNLVINLRTAKALGLDVPLNLQQLADELIE
jgi:putative tryptophan/tyrosine transport system substrate-binding protein